MDLMEAWARNKEPLVSMEKAQVWMAIAAGVSHTVVQQIIG
jgi:hypothetical protein